MEPVFGWLLTVVVAGFFTLVGVSTLRAERRRAATGTVTDGVVVDHAWASSSGVDGPDLYARPVIEFMTASGERRRFTESFGTGHPLSPGTPVRVRYDPADPAVEPVRAGTTPRIVLPALFATLLGISACSADGELARLAR